MSVSKQAMARELVALGCGKSVNTLRRYSVEQLETLLKQHANSGETGAEQAPNAPACAAESVVAGVVPEPATPSVPAVPTDAELIRAARPVEPVPAPEPAWYRWYGLTLRGVVAALSVFAWR
jgi:hypothetical protein